MKLIAILIAVGIILYYRVSLFGHLVKKKRRDPQFGLLIYEKNYWRTEELLFCGIPVVFECDDSYKGVTDTTRELFEKIKVNFSRLNQTFRFHFAKELLIWGAPGQDDNTRLHDVLSTNDKDGLEEFFILFHISVRTNRETSKRRIFLGYRCSWEPYIPRYIVLDTNLKFVKYGLATEVGLELPDLPH